MKDTTLLLASIVTALMLTACGTTSTTEPDLPENRLASQYIRLGVGYMQEGKFELALARLQRALELNPMSPVALYNHGLVLGEQGHPKQARRQLRKALAIRPTYAEAQAALDAIEASSKN